MKGRRECPRHLRLVRPAADARRLGEAEVWRRVGGDLPREEPWQSRIRPDVPAVGRRVASRLVVVRTASVRGVRK